MPTKMQAVAICNKYNQQRMVNTTASYSISRFWQQANSNFLIAGGSSLCRQSVLTSKLSQCLQRGDRPIIILSGNSQLASTLIHWVSTQPAHLTISSPQYRNYHFFYGMSDVEIASFFRDIAEKNGYDGLPALETYIMAFLDVLRKRFIPSLPAMLSLSLYEDTAISALGRSLGSAPRHLAALDQHAAAGDAFRSLLGNLQHEFSHLSDLETNSKTNLITSVLQGNLDQERSGQCTRIHLVDISSAEQNIISRYMAGEINFLLHNNRPFRLILDNVALSGSEKLVQSIANACNNYQCEIGICSANPYVSGLENQMLRGLSSRVILLDGSSLDPHSLESLLSTYGTYEHWEPILQPGAGLFLHPFSNDWTTTHMTRNRIRMEDVSNSVAVLSGQSKANVATLVRRLVD